MATKTTRTCLRGCGRPVHGQGVKICDDCAPKCPCGRRRLADRPRCRRCAARISELEKQTAGRGDRQIVWVKNRRGIFVARR